MERVAAFLHADKLTEAAQEIAAFSKMSIGPAAIEPVAKELCYSLLGWCLENDRYDLAASMLWGETLFTYKPRCTRMVWEEIKNNSSLMMMGSASMSKSYGAGVWLLLDWIRDPEYTNVNLIGPSEDHLKDNLFTHLVTLHQSSTLPLPGHIGDLFIGLDSKKRKGAIRGIIVPIGKRPAGRLQGKKLVPRKTPHPKFGGMSRMRVFIDELEKVPTGIYKDLDNLFANFSGDTEAFKILCAFNPEDPNGPAATRCEPEKGWPAFNADTDEIWTSKRGWRVLRLDAAKCENVVQKKMVYQGLQSYEGFCRIIQNAGGMDSPGYWSMARGCFPRGGAVYSVLSSTQLEKFKGEFIFAEAPIEVGAVDLALEGGDTAEFSQGRFGKAAGYRLPPTPDFPKGKEFLFTDSNGARRVQWALQIDQVFPLPSAETVAMAQAVKENMLRLHIKPEHMMLDRTGNGAGVHDLLKDTMPEIMGINYSQAATKRKILEEDTHTPLEDFERAASELWFALKAWIEFGFVKIKPATLGEDLSKELGSRRYAPGKTRKVESKPDYKARGNGSPNKADTVTLLLAGVRQAFLCTPSAKEGMTGILVQGSSGGDRPEPECRVDSTNRFEDLESSESDGRAAYGDTFPGYGFN